MNNQYIIKFIIASKSAKGFIIKKQKEEEEERRRQDAEILNLYNKGYFNPPEYQEYTERDLTYQDMIDLFSDRMNDMYYYNYVDRKYYNEGKLTDEQFEDYEYFFNGFYYEGDIGYDDYIRALELTLQIINSNY